MNAIEITIQFLQTHCPAVGATVLTGATCALPSGVVRGTFRSYVSILTSVGLLERKEGGRLTVTPLFLNLTTDEILKRLRSYSPASSGRQRREAQSKPASRDSEAKRSISPLKPVAVAAPVPATDVTGLQATIAELQAEIANFRAREEPMRREIRDLHVAAARRDREIEGLKATRTNLTRRLEAVREELNRRTAYGSRS